MDVTTLHSPILYEIDFALLEIESHDEPRLCRKCAVGKIVYVVWSDVFNCPECAEGK